jgi:hypothetical protein
MVQERTERQIPMRSFHAVWRSEYFKKYVACLDTTFAIAEMTWIQRTAGVNLQK